MGALGGFPRSMDRTHGPDPWTDVTGLPHSFGPRDVSSSGGCEFRAGREHAARPKGPMLPAAMSRNQHRWYEWQAAKKGIMISAAPAPSYPIARATGMDGMVKQAPAYRSPR